MIKIPGLKVEWNLRNHKTGWRFGISFCLSGYLLEKCVRTVSVEIHIFKSSFWFEFGYPKTRIERYLAWKKDSLTMTRLRG